MKKKKIIIQLLPFLIFLGCNGQTKKENESLLSSGKEHTKIIEDTLNKPKVRVKVNKQYDDKGNLIKYDSTYSYIYSGPGGGELQLNNDTVYNRFRSYFDRKYPDFFSPQFDDIFLNDSLFKYDFFNKDYFMQRFKLNREMFERMYRQMDSIKGDFMERNYPQGYQKKNEKIKNQ